MNSPLCCIFHLQSPLVLELVATRIGPHNIVLEKEMARMDQRKPTEEVRVEGAEYRTI